MHITNRYKLPLNMDLFTPREPNKNTLSVTRMIDSPLIQLLTLREWDNLEQDVSDMLYMMEGEAVHSIMEKHAETGAIVEENMALMVGDTMVTARADKFHGNEVTDWKGTSVWTYMRAKKENGTGARDEWIKQLNVYAFLFRMKGTPVDKLTVWLKFRDWTPSEAARSGPDYPACGFAKCDLPLWTQEEQLAYIQERISVHKACQESGGAYICSDHERWTKPTSWAVMKKGRKTAVAVFGPGQPRGGGQKEADDYASTLSASPITVEVRPGGHIRCELYCPVRRVCPVLKNEAQQVYVP